MLGFSIQKILLLVAILGAVWWGFKWVSRLDRLRKAADKTASRSGAPRVEEMVECPACKTYQVPKADKSCSNCGRPL